MIEEAQEHTKDARDLVAGKAALEAYLDRDRRRKLGWEVRKAYGETNEGRQANRALNEIYQRLYKTTMRCRLLAPYAKELLRRSRRTRPLPRNCRIQTAYRVMESVLFWGRNFEIAGVKFKIASYLETYTLYVELRGFDLWCVEYRGAKFRQGENGWHLTFPSARDAIRAVKAFVAANETVPGVTPEGTRVS